MRTRETCRKHMAHPFKKPSKTQHPTPPSTTPKPYSKYSFTPRYTNASAGILAPYSHMAATFRRRPKETYTTNHYLVLR